MKHFLSITMVFVILASFLAGCSAVNQTTGMKESAPQNNSGSGRTDSTAPSAGDARQPAGAEKSAAPAQSTFSADRLVIYDATLSLTVRDSAESIDIVNQLAKDAGGFIASSSTRYERDQQIATLTLKIPALVYDDFMSRLRKSAIKVTREDSKTQDVTEEYSDLQAQLRNLEATEAQYLELLKRAQTIDDILKVQQRLSDTRGQIERTKGRITYLERRSDMATITVNLVPETLEKARTSVWEPLRVAADAWQASLAFLAGISNILITAVVFFWWLILFIAVALFLLRNRFSHQKRKEVGS